MNAPSSNPTSISTGNQQQSTSNTNNNLINNSHQNNEQNNHLMNNANLVENNKINELSNNNSTNNNISKITNGSSSHNTNNNNNNNNLNNIKPPNILTNDVNKENVPTTTTTATTAHTNTTPSSIQSVNPTTNNSSISNGNRFQKAVAVTVPLTESTVPPNQQLSQLPSNDAFQTGPVTTSNHYSTNNNANVLTNNNKVLDSVAILDPQDVKLNEVISTTTAPSAISTSNTTNSGAAIQNNTSIGASVTSSNSSSSSSTTVANSSSNSASNRLDATTPGVTNGIANTNSDYLLTNKLNDLNAVLTSNLNNNQQQQQQQSTIPSMTTTLPATTCAPVLNNNLTSLITTPISGSSIPQPIQANNSNRFITSLSTTATSASANKPHQRGITSIGPTSNISGSNTVKLKKSDTGRGTIDFPKSASTDKSRIESFLNRNIPNSSIQDNNDQLRATSYRPKGEILQNSLQSHNLNNQQSAAAAANVGGASMLTSLTTSNGAPNSAVKSLSAAPIKPNETSLSNNTSVPKSELRPRLDAQISFLLNNLNFYKKFKSTRKLILLIQFIYVFGIITL